MKRTLLLAGTALLALLALTLLAIGLTAPSTPTPSPTTFQEGPDDFSAWAETVTTAGHPVYPILADTALADQAQANDALLVLTDPNPLTEHQAHVLDAHLEQGGTLLVYDPDGNLNPWFNQHGLTVANRTILDPNSDTHVRTLATLETDSFEPVKDQAPSTLLIEEDDGWSITRHAPADTFLDIDGNGNVDRTDRPGPHPIEAIRTIGDGVLIAAASNMLRNDAYQAPDAQNEAYMQALLDQLVDPRSPIIISEADSGWTPTEAPAAASVQHADAIQRLGPLATGALFLIITALAIASVQTASTLEPYPPHDIDTDPVEPENAAQDPDLLEHLAWETVAVQMNEPAASLQDDGLAALEGALDLDPVFQRALTGQATEDDAPIIASRYQSVTNHD